MDSNAIKDLFENLLERQFYSADEIRFHIFFKEENSWKRGLFKTKNSYLKDFIDLYNDRLHGIEKTDKQIKPFRKVIFNIIDDPTLGATSGKSKTKENLYFIGFKVGTIQIIHDLCFRIFSHKENFKNIGDAQLETIDKPTIRNYYENFIDLIELGSLELGEFHRDEPKCRMRKDFSELIREIVFEFLFTHELFHIINGHLDFLEKSRQLDNLDLRTLEWDADCLATCKLLKSYIKFYKKAKEDKLSKATKEIFNSLSSVIFIVSYSIQLCIRITAERSSIKYKTLNDVKHSKPRLRWFHTVRTIEDYMKKNYKDEISEQEIREACFMATIECEQNYRNLTGNQTDIEPFNEIFSTEAREHDKMIRKNWKSLKSKLEKYAFVKLVD